MSDDSERIAAIRARVDAATAGPWVMGGDDIYHPGPTDEWADRSYVFMNGDTFDTGGIDTDDGLFVIHARADVPWLLDRVQALEAALAAARAREAALAQWCVDEGGMDLFAYRECDPPAGIFDLSDRFNPRCAAVRAAPAAEGE